MHWITASHPLSILDSPHIMAILNVTPDSFSDGSPHATDADHLRAIESFLHLGVSIIDIGGQSTRPGATLIDPHTEWQRIHSILPRAIALSQGHALISVDTFYGYVAAKALDAGAHIINDVSGAQWTSDTTWPIIASHPTCGYVLTHAQDPPATMHLNPTYENIIQQIQHYFSQKIQHLQSLGVSPHRIAIDPGIGFAKNTQHNLHILRNLQAFQDLHRPILIGLSRKRLIRDLLQLPTLTPPIDPSTLDLLDNATTLFNLIATTRGAHIWRVHNPQKALTAIRLWKALHPSPSFNPPS
jgi:dihydropteroate synthase